MGPSSGQLIAIQFNEKLRWLSERIAVRQRERWGARAEKLREMQLIHTLRKAFMRGKLRCRFQY